MSIVVQKYGGSSVATVEKIKAVAMRVAKTRQSGQDVVVTISAMGDTTDDLLELARHISLHPSHRELDFLLSTGEQVSSALLALALQELNVPAISLTGWQAGIMTDDVPTKARIEKIHPTRIEKHLAEGKVVVVAGFQGVTTMERDGEIMTLGRGGTDTTAVALAAALGSEACEIYTDVDGVYTTDPRIVPKAQKIDTIGYEEMLELAASGARVMHERAVELGSFFNIPIVVRNSHNDNPGTTITKEQSSMEPKNRVSGIAYDNDVGVLSIIGVRDSPGIAATLFSALADRAIATDIIVQGTNASGLADISFTVSLSDVPKAQEELNTLLPELQAQKVLVRDDVAKISIVGTGIKNHPTYPATMFQMLSEKGINIHMIGTSSIRITCVIDKDRIVEAVQILHEAFQLEK